MKILWLSRHEATEVQVAQLKEKFGEVEIIQKNVTITGGAQQVVDLFQEVGADEMVVVLPPHILADLTSPRWGVPKPIRAVMNREVLENGEAIFTHSHFERVEKIEIVTSPL